MLPISIEEEASFWQEQLTAIDQAITLEELLGAAWRLACSLTIGVVEKTLTERGERPNVWEACPQGGHRLESKGLKGRELTTVFGVIRWKRRVGRCPNKCPIGQIAPLDQALGLVPNQRMEGSLKRKACLLAVFLPFETASLLLAQLSGVQVSATGIWQWVQAVGAQLAIQLEADLQDLAEGHLPDPEACSPALADLPLVIGSDGVMVPFRQQFPL